MALSPTPDLTDIAEFRGVICVKQLNTSHIIDLAKRKSIMLTILTTLLLITIYPILQELKHHCRLNFLLCIWLSGWTSSATIFGIHYMDNIPAELVRASGEDAITTFTTICNKIWQKEEWQTLGPSSWLSHFPRKARKSTTLDWYRFIWRVRIERFYCLPVFETTFYFLRQLVTLQSGIPPFKTAIRWFQRKWSFRSVVLGQKFIFTEMWRKRFQKKKIGHKSGVVGGQGFICIKIRRGTLQKKIVLGGEVIGQGSIYMKIRRKRFGKKGCRKRGYLPFRDSCI